MTANQDTQGIIKTIEEFTPEIKWCGPPQLVIVRAPKMNEEEFKSLSKTLNDVNEEKSYFYFIVIESEEDTKITFEYPLNHNLCSPPMFTLSNAKIEDFQPRRKTTTPTDLTQ